jgi:hypothetical protein
MEMMPHQFAKALGFRMLSADNVAVNPDPVIDFRVETFERSDNFNPDKPFLTHLRSRGPDGTDLNRLLLTEPQSALAVVLRRETESAPDPKNSPAPPARVRKPRRRDAAPQQWKLARSLPKSHLVRRLTSACIIGIVYLAAGQFQFSGLPPNSTRAKRSPIPSSSSSPRNVSATATPVPKVFPNSISLLKRHEVFLIEMH